MRLGRVLIVGGGIGGLCAAIALHPHAESVVLVERAEAFAPVGAGIILAANAIMALRGLGVDLAPHGKALPEMVIRSASGAALSRARPSDVCPEAPAVAIHRASLHEVLLAHLPSGVEVRLGQAVAGLQEEGEGVTVSFEGGSAERFDLVLGADGLHSVVRRALGGPTPEYSGYTCWRAVLPDPGLQEGGEIWGQGKRFGYVPLPGGLAYVFLVCNAPPHSRATAEALQQRFADCAEPVPSLLAHLPGAAVVQHDLSDLPSQAWGQGRIWLLGDAAHAVLPNEGQGAAMAIEDALALRLAMREASLPAAHERYVALRSERVATIHRDSRALGRVGQWENPLMVALRDTLLRWTPAAMGRRQLRRVVEPGIALASQVRS